MPLTTFAYFCGSIVVYMCNDADLAKEISLLEQASYMINKKKYFSFLHFENLAHHIKQEGQLTTTN
jgi:hypothetical protein